VATLEKRRIDPGDAVISVSRGTRLPCQPDRPGQEARNHIRQLEALGYTVTLTQAA
jgi:hypothetical protein